MTNHLYDQLHNRVDEFLDAGFEPDRIVVPAEDWSGVKERAEILDGEGFLGADKTLVNGVRVTYSTTLGSARVVFQEPGPGGDS